MCSSHYEHLNEYSHVLAQKCIALVKCKNKKFKSVKKKGIHFNWMMSKVNVKYTVKGLIVAD